MPAARRGRRIAAIAVSAAAHLLVLGELALHAPSLTIPLEPGGPPQPIIPVLLAPRLPPAAAASPPQPIRLHRRRTRFSDLPLAPLPAPPGPEVPPAPPGPVALHPAPLPEGPKGEVRQALRQGPVGCANQDAVGLTKAERQLCDQVLGKNAKNAPFLGLGIAQGKAADFDRAASRKEADRRWREAPIPPGPAGAGGDSGQPWQTPSDPRR